MSSHKWIDPQPSRCYGKHVHSDSQKKSNHALDGRILHLLAIRRTIAFMESSMTDRTTSAICMYLYCEIYPRRG
jgi:hypothetical protein